MQLFRLAYDIKSQSSNAIIEPDPSPLASQKAKGKVISSEVVISSSQAAPPKSKFFHKTNFQNICSAENGFYDANPYVFAKRMFSEKFLYTPYDNYKTPEFYERILEETQSVTFRHFEDKGHVNYSTARIHRVIHPSQWQPDTLSLNKFKNKTNEALPYRSSFSYFDYQQAWWNTFWRKNANNTHTWLFFFENFDIRTAPYWFLRWWELLGPTDEILHPKTRPSYELFLEKFQPLPHEKNFPKLMLFFYYFGVSWVIGWYFDYRKSPDTGIPILIRRFKTKWWDGFKFFDRVSTKAVTKWLNERLSLSPPPPGEITPFLHDKGFVLSRLASAQSQQQLTQLLKQALSDIEETGSSHSHHDGNSNEDDCYGILPRIPWGDVAEQEEEEEDESIEDLSKP